MGFCLLHFCFLIDKHLDGISFFVYDSAMLVWFQALYFQDKSWTCGWHMIPAPSESQQNSSWLAIDSQCYPIYLSKDIIIVVDEGVSIANAKLQRCCEDVDVRVQNCYTYILLVSRCKLRWSYLIFVRYILYSSQGEETFLCFIAPRAM